MIYIPDLDIEEDYKYFIDLEQFYDYVKRVRPNPIPSFYYSCLEEIDTDFDVEEGEDIIYYVQPDYSKKFNIEYSKEIIELYLKDFDTNA